MSSAAYRHQIEAFVDGWRGWHIAEPEPGKVYAWRVIEIVDVAYHLRVQRDPEQVLMRGRWLSSWVSSGGTIGSTFSGTPDEVVAEITAVERCLDVIVELDGCRTGAAARELMEPLKPGQIRVMCEVLGLRGVGDPGYLKQQILQRLCGSLDVFPRGWSQR
jgi:hypothetical protein